MPGSVYQPAEGEPPAPPQQPPEDELRLALGQLALMAEEEPEEELLLLETGSPPCEPAAEFYPPLAPALLAEQLNLGRKRSVNMTECVPVPSSEHVAEIVGRQDQGCQLHHVMSLQHYNII